MNTQTTDASQESWTFEDVYNLLMERIEPELCTYNLPILEDLYKGESKEEQAERFAHYEKCFLLLKDVMSELKQLTKKDLQTFERAFLQDIKGKITSDEASHITDLERDISES